jgi:hypothetical protein
MKQSFFLALLMLAEVFSYGQDNRVSLTGGYSFAVIKDVDTHGSGWNIRGLYEFNRVGDNLAHGISIGVIHFKASSDDRSSEVTTWPVVYAPKLFFGGGSFRGFVKIAVGLHTTRVITEGPALTSDDMDFGFFGGLGAGVEYLFNEKFFINAEYELDFLSNSYYKDGLINNISLGLGMRF